SVTCTAIRTLTQADIDAGTYSNVATAYATVPNGYQINDPSDDPDNPANVDPNNDGNPDDPTVTLLPANPDITVTKTGALNLGGDNKLNAGDVINYTITVTNVGNVTLTNVGITDPNASNLACNPATPVASLAPGASITCTASHTITQANINSGSYTNVATATGTPPTGPNVTDNSDDPTDPTNSDPNNDGDPDDPTVTLLPQAPDVTIAKQDVLILGPDNKLNAGDQINYTITVTNVGNVTLSNITVNDPGTSGLTCNPPVPFLLQPGESATCTATHVLTQAEIDGGSYLNVATVSAEPPSGPPVTDASDDPDNPANVDPNNDGDPDDPTVTPLPASPGIAVTKTDVLNLGPDNKLNAGDQITYTITVTNTGNVTLSNVTVSDPGTTGLACVPAAPFSLAPGASVSCTATRTITQADLDAGTYSNVATATGTTPGGQTVTDNSDDPDNPTNADPNNDGNPDDPTVTSLPASPALSVLKTDVLDMGPNGTPDIGDIITYTITVTNTGNVTISNITVNDPNATGLTCIPATPFSLAPGQSVSCTAIHTLTADDLNTRIVTNVATASGQTPGGAQVSDASDDPDNPANADPNNDGNPDDPTVTQLPCATIEAWVYLEGSAIFPDGSENYAVPMRTTLNNLRILPGQTYNDFFLGSFYTPAGQPYNTAPWNYNGNEGDAYDSGGDINFADAGYPSTVTDWVLVSLRSDPEGTGGPICQAAALLHKDGHIEFVDDFDCCDINLNQSYYVVIEHRNHLIVMSHVPVPIVNGKISYDFRVQQTYINDPFGFGVFVGQKQILPGIYAMYAGNGNQTLTNTSDTDINFDDRTYWEGQNGTIARYRNGDYNLNGDTNFNDRRVWELNNGRFTSVPRN
ncbi:MAG: DUF11 domain-containing protein, partial [Thermoanaerobaculia bacterium]|nr:DUF11 domain-containing protein [Thermoanaerobaculia bacterium]